MRLFNSEKHKSECKCSDGCNCERSLKTPSCECCNWYRMIDSGFGVCNALPNHSTVPWCKEPCSLFLVGYNFGTCNELPKHHTRDWCTQPCVSSPKPPLYPVCRVERAEWSAIRGTEGLVGVVKGCRAGVLCLAAR